MHVRVPGISAIILSIVALSMFSVIWFLVERRMFTVNAWFFCLLFETIFGHCKKLLSVLV
jgi:hypothetical protein